jgi:hypothetical protein
VSEVDHGRDQQVRRGEGYDPSSPACLGRVEMGCGLAVAFDKLAMAI